MSNNEVIIKLIDILSEKEKISESQISQVLSLAENSTNNCEVIFLKSGISEIDLSHAYSQYYGLEYINIDSVIPENDALSVLPYMVAERLNVLPISLHKNCLSIVISNPSDLNMMEELRMLPYKLNMYVAPKSELSLSIKFHYKFSGILYKQSSKATNIFTEVTNVAEEIIDYLLKKSIKDNASDIHFEPLKDRARVRYRVDGMLFDIMTFRIEFYAQVVSRIKILANMDIAEKRHPRDGRILYSYNDLNVDIRISSLPTIYGEKIVLRLLKQDSSILDLSKLGFDAQQIIFLENATKIKTGLIVVSGPTGSGKSTTLHTLMKIMNDTATNLISIEDPVEYTLEGINQVQVNEKIGLHFSNILRSVLRQDPDKIMVGEIRDLETAELAVRAALTGHLVLTTLHADDSVGVITRLIDMGIKPYLLASALKCVISQRLVRLLCDNCKKYHDSSHIEMGMLNQEKSILLAHATGCEQCRFSGFRGRTVIAEMIEIDNNLRNMINQNVLKQKYIDYMKNNNISSLRDSLAAKIVDCKIPIEEFYLM